MIFSSYKFTNYNKKRNIITLHMKSILFCLHFLPIFVFLKHFSKNMQTSNLNSFCVKSSEIFRTCPERIVINPTGWPPSLEQYSAWTISLCDNSSRHFFVPSIRNAVKSQNLHQCIFHHVWKYLQWAQPLVQAICKIPTLITSNEDNSVGRVV